MASFPELEAIEVDTPPCSPSLFTEDSFDAPDVHEVASPVKRARSTRVAQPSKRLKSHAAPCSVQMVDAQPNHDPSREAPYLDYGTDLDYGADLNYSVESIEENPDKLDGYLAAVKANIAGFYPISDELYVVKGWDENLECVKACFFHCLRDL